MDARFVITTTNNIEGCSIEKYIGAICSNVVIGTNFFSDFAASFTDFFGGRSASYKRKLEIIYNEASKELKQKALMYGANAIVGFKVDFDEVSGKEKSMFMVSASGTACLVDYKRSKDFSQDEKSNIIYQSDLDDELYRRLLVSEINEGKHLKEKYVEYLVSSPQMEVLDELINRYLNNYKDEYYLKEVLPSIERIISAYDKTDILKSVYDRCKTAEPKAIISLIKKCRLFDAQSILALCDETLSLAIRLLSAPSDYYNSKELDIMKKIDEKLSNLPDTGTVESVKSGLLGKVQEKYICANGHKNEVDSSFCKSCGINMKGLTPVEVDEIMNFENRITALEYLLNKSQNEN